MLKRLLRIGLGFSPRLPGYRRLARHKRARALTVFMYHGVTRDPLPVFNWCQLDARLFAKQVRFLAREYTVLPLAEAVERLAGGLPLPEYAAVVTFDDGCRNVFTTAYPILQRYRVPATVFLVTSLLETRQPPWTERLFHALGTTRKPTVRLGGEEWPLHSRGQRHAANRALHRRLTALAQPEQEERFEGLLRQLGVEREVPADSPLATLDWEEVQEMARGGLVTFGSHTHTHPILSRCSPETQREELRVSRDILRERLGGADLFAYPNGSRADFTADTKRLLAELGYRCALATVPGLNRPGADLYELRRVGVGADSNFAQFQFDSIAC
jgi:peptidoglycan/xylan/chitin deacetylase (PgdA/CDA1 family)